MLLLLLLFPRTFRTILLPDLDGLPEMLPDAFCKEPRMYLLPTKLSAPLSSMPLALLDGATIDTADLVRVALLGRGALRRGDRPAAEEHWRSAMEQVIAARDPLLVLRIARGWEEGQCLRAQLLVVGEVAEFHGPTLFKNPRELRRAVLGRVRLGEKAPSPIYEGRDAVIAWLLSGGDSSGAGDQTPVLHVGIASFPIEGRGLGTTAAFDGMQDEPPPPPLEGLSAVAIRPLIL